MLNKLHIFVSLIAGIFFTIYGIVNDFDFFFWLKNIVIVLMLFYILGLITRHYLRKVLAPRDTEVVEVTEEEIVEESADAEESTDNKPKKKIDFSSDEEDEN